MRSAWPPVMLVAPSAAAEENSKRAHGFAQTGTSIDADSEKGLVRRVALESPIRASRPLVRSSFGRPNEFSPREKG